MYKGIKSNVSYNGEQSSFFSSFRGAKQGENVSPVSFAFLNDFESLLCGKSSNGVNFKFQYCNIALYLKLSVLLYADDAIVFGTDETDLQKKLRYVLQILRIMALIY